MKFKQKQKKYCMCLLKRYIVEICTIPVFLKILIYLMRKKEALLFDDKKQKKKLYYSWGRDIY